MHDKQKDYFKGKRIASANIRSDGVIINQACYKYDNNENLIESIETDYKGNQTGKSLLRYDITGNVTEEIKFDIIKITGQNELKLKLLIIYRYRYYD